MEEYKTEANNSTFILNSNNHVDILYLCDKKQCHDCSYPLCKHTLDISHAVSFKNDVGNTYIEKG